MKKTIIAILVLGLISVVALSFNRKDRERHFFVGWFATIDKAPYSGGTAVSISDMTLLSIKTQLIGKDTGRVKDVIILGLHEFDTRQELDYFVKNDMPRKAVTIQAKPSYFLEQ